MTWLALVIAAVAVVDWFQSPKSIETLRSRLTSYYFYVEELPFSQEFPSHVATVRRLLQKNAHRFIVVAASVLTSFVIIVFVAERSSFSSDPQGYVKRHIESGYTNMLVSTLAGQRLSEAANESLPKELSSKEFSPEKIIAACEKRTSDPGCAAFLTEMSRIRADEESLRNQIARAITERSNIIGPKIVAALVAATAISSVLYFVSFVISILITLFLMRFMEQARASSALVIFLDLALAFFIPIFAITLAFSIFVFTVPFEGWLLPKDLSSDNFDERVFSLYATFALFFGGNAQLMIAKLLSVFAIINPDVELFGSISRAIGTWGGTQAQEFFLDINKGLSVGWHRIPIRSAQRDWTIALSLIFSLSYIVAIAFLLATKRSHIFRAAIGRTLQRFAEHQRGPVNLLLLILAALLATMGQVI